MSRDSTPSLSFPTPGADRLTTLDRTPSPAAEKAKLGELAAQFESMLMLEMIKQMRKSLLDDGAEGEGLGNETYSSTIDGELALHLAKAGGMGLTPMMVDAWERQQAAVAPGSLTTPAAGRPIPVNPAAASSPTTRPVDMSVVRQAMPGAEADVAATRTALSLEMSGADELGLRLAARPAEGTFEVPRRHRPCSWVWHRGARRCGRHGGDRRRAGRLRPHGGHPTPGRHRVAVCTSLVARRQAGRQRDPWPADWAGGKYGPVDRSTSAFRGDGRLVDGWIRSSSSGI